MRVKAWAIFRPDGFSDSMSLVISSPEPRLVVLSPGDDLLARRPQQDRVLVLRRHRALVLDKGRVVSHDPVRNKLVQLQESHNEEGRRLVSEERAGPEGGGGRGEGTGLTPMRYPLSPRRSR